MHFFLRQESTMRFVRRILGATGSELFFTCEKAVAAARSGWRVRLEGSPRSARGSAMTQSLPYHHVRVPLTTVLTTTNLRRTSQLKRRKPKIHVKYICNPLYIWNFIRYNINLHGGRVSRLKAIKIEGLDVSSTAPVCEKPSLLR